MQILNTQTVSISFKLARIEHVYSSDPVIFSRATNTEEYAVRDRVYKCVAFFLASFDFTNCSAECILI